MERIELQGKRVKIEKIDAVRFKDEGHPKGIDTGYRRIGTALNDVVVGNQFSMGHVGYFRTSRVLEIRDERTFVTKNSVYTVELLEGIVGDEMVASGVLDCLPYLDEVS